MASHINYIRNILPVSLILVCFSITHSAQAQELNGDSSAKRGQDVLVNVAYGTQPKWLISGAVSTVKGSEMQQTFTSNLLNTLTGRLPGLTVRQSAGEPGLDAPQLNIRGISTFGAGTTSIGPSSAPLIL
ncbi:MAG TPA: TonB-dependent receptor plug domain-containing protein, partial [Puia sp.]